MNQPVSLMFLNLPDRRAKVLRHLLYATANARRALWVVLEIAEHLSEILRPRFQLWCIRNWDSKHLRSDRIGQRLRQIGDHIHTPLSLNSINEIFSDVTNVGPEGFDSVWRKSTRRESSDSCVPRRIEEQHLPDHYFSNRGQILKPHCRKLLRRRSSLRRIIMQHCDNVVVTGNDPRMQKSIPVNRVLRSKAMKKRIRIAE